MMVTGNIQKRKRKNGYAWEITIEMPPDPITKKRNRTSKTVNGTKKEAEQVMRKLIAEAEKGYYVTNDNISITEWIHTWLDVYIIPNVSPTTLSRYQGMIKRYIDPLIGHIPVQKLTTLAAQSWVNGLKASPITSKEMAPATIKHAYHVLKGAMDKAVLAGIIARSPCQGIMLPKRHKKEPVVYDEKQIKRLIEAAKGTEMELVIDLELCTGMRRGELLGLQWRDVDWEKKRISIVRNRVVVNSKSVVKEPKTETSIRTLDMPVQLMQKLWKHRLRCMERKMSIVPADFEEEFIIVHPDGRPIYPEYLSQMFTKLQKRAELPRCAFHNLRHLCASIMLLQGVNVKVAQARLGHKDIATTVNIRNPHTNKTQPKRFDICIKRTA